MESSVSIYSESIFADAVLKSRYVVLFKVQEELTNGIRYIYSLYKLHVIVISTAIIMFSMPSSIEKKVIGKILGIFSWNIT